MAELAMYGMFEHRKSTVIKAAEVTLGLATNVGRWSVPFDSLSASPVAVHQSKTADWQSRRRNYRVLLRTKRDVFWRSQTATSYSRPRELWSTFDSILCRGL